MTIEECRAFVQAERLEAYLWVAVPALAFVLLRACWQQWGHRLW
jgi:hypothetical protein